jgi:peptidoglycan/xylan/chitin deacetylase (PgdA/CDA1 family)
MKRFLAALITLPLLMGMLLPMVAVSADSPNLIANPSVEVASGNGPANWTPDSWGTNTTTMTYQNSGHTGTKSLSISTTAYTNGDAKWIPDAAPVTPNQSYTYNEFYESNVATELDAQYTDASGAVSYVYLENVPASTSWAPASVAFTTPATATKVSVLHILAGAGTLQTDDFSLATTTVVTPPANTNGNLILNPSFETANGNTPVDWQTGGWGTNTTSFSYATNDGHTGTASAKVQTTSYTNGDAKWYFNPVAVKPSTQYTFSDFYKSTIATSLVAEYVDASGNLTYQTLSAPAAASAWQQASVTFTTPATATSMTMFHLIAGVGTLQIDDASLMLPTVVTPPVNPTGPTVTVTAPTAASSVSGTVTVSATATAISPAKITNVQFELDGAKLGTADTTAPYQATWNTTTATNGSHNLTAIVTTSDKKTATAPAVAVTVNNSPFVGSNLIPNPSMETADPANTKAPLDWFSSSWGTNTSKFTYLTTGHTGTHSLKTQITAYTNGAAYWDFNDQPIVGGQMYDFSDYYESTIPSEIDASITMSDGSVQYLYLGDAFASPSSWTKFDTQFTAPVGAVSVSMEHNIFAVGTLTTDDFSLTPFTYQSFNRAIVSITDDDGYASFYNNGLPILQKYGLKSTDYIISSYVGTVNGTGNAAGYMNSTQVKALYAAGEEIGSHSVTHPDLTTLNATQQDNELKNSQTFLQTLLGVPVTDYAAPYGAVNQQVVTDAQKYYQSYRGVGAGYNSKNNFNAFNLYVQNMDDTTTLAQVQGWIAEAQATNTWLVLVYHEVNPDSSAGLYNTYPADFDAQMSAIKNSGIAVETVSQALKETEAQL